MTKYIDTEKLNAEIERLYDGEAPKHDQQCDFDDGYFTGIGTISQFIDSLKQEQLDIDEIKREWYNKGYLEGRKNVYIPARELGLHKSWDFQQEQPIQVNTLTWRDINDLERIINNVHYEFRNGISEKGFGEEVLERFMKERDEQEQPKVDLNKEIRFMWEKCNPTDEGMGVESTYMHIEAFDIIARYFYELGLNARKEENK